MTNEIQDQQSTIQELPPKPKIEPTFLSTERLGSSDLPFSLSLLSNGEETTHDDDENGWIPILSIKSNAPISSLLATMSTLIRSPERNSSNILRAEILSESDQMVTEEEEGNKNGWKCTNRIKRRILPRRPNLDWEMEQDCCVYRKKVFQEEEQQEEEAVVVYTPLIGVTSHPKMILSNHLTSNNPSSLEQHNPQLSIGSLPPNQDWIPFYHPKVRAIAFHFTTDQRLQLYLIPFTRESKYPSNHRLSRVSLSLLTTIHNFSFGHLNNYIKRVHHDQIIAKDQFQDLYLLLKNRYAAKIIESWIERTDPKKHVFEDLAIAAFLILLWKDMFSSSSSSMALPGHPPGGFVDIGCGNGLLVYILTQEGYSGFGMDLRKRRSWSIYQSSGTDLRQISMDPVTMVTSNHQDLIPTSSFLIGNHSDELTPWIPILATSFSCSGFLNLPCCLYSLSGFKFTSLSSSSFSLPDSLPISQKKIIQLGPPSSTTTTTNSRNLDYLKYLSFLHIQFGWVLEKEPLRIPSTKNWAFIGRSRIWSLFPSNSCLESEWKQYTSNNIQSHVTPLIGNWKARESS